MVGLLVKWALCAVSLLCVGYIYSGVEIHSFGSALIAALVIGLCNAVVRPVLVVLTLPVTIITLGLFLLVINALMFWAASGLAGSGFAVHGFWAALIGSVLYSIISLAVQSAVGSLRLSR